MCNKLIYKTEIAAIRARMREQGSYCVGNRRGKKLWNVTVMAREQDSGEAGCCVKEEDMKKVRDLQSQDQLPDGLIAQSVEHCTGITEVMGSNPVQA